MEYLELSGIDMRGFLIYKLVVYCICLVPALCLGASTVLKLLKFLAVRSVMLPARRATPESLAIDEAVCCLPALL